jgi:hypothetical protein
MDATVDSLRLEGLLHPKYSTVKRSKKMSNNSRHKKVKRKGRKQAQKLHNFTKYSGEKYEMRASKRLAVMVNPIAKVSRSA